MSDAGRRDLRGRFAAPRVAVLGPAAIGPASAPHPVTGRVGRLLVALAAASTPTDLDTLSEAVWGHDPPATYRSALHVHLGSLRRLLAAHEGSCRVVRVGDGYSLELGDWELDSRLAVDLLDEARTAMATDPRRAFGFVEQALALWRGTPFSADGDVVDTPSSHELDAVRREGEELLVETLLRLGDAAAAEATARRAVDAEPLRENRWGQLLRARYLAGRTADALATYHEARDVLIDSLGIEPGPDLRALEAAALTHDAARLRLPDLRADPLPAFPSSIGRLFGRDEELHRLVETITATRRIAILGSPGVGKSLLAAEASRQLGMRDVAWVDLRQPEHDDADAALRRVAEWARRYPDGLVVLDNGEAAGPAVRRGIDELAHRAPTVRVIVTSRVPVGADIAVEILAPLELPDPDADDAEIEAAPSVQTLRAAMRELAPAVTLSSADVAALCRRSGGLPVCLRLTAAAARSLPVVDILALPPSTLDDEVDRATRAVLEVVGAEAGSALLSISVLTGAFDADLGARIAGLAADRFSAALVELIDHGLVHARPQRGQPFAVPEPIRAVAARLLDQTGRRLEGLERLVDACIDRARALQQRSTSGMQGLEARLDADLPRHREALAHLARTGDADRALTLVCRLEGSLYALGWWAEKVELFDLALSIPGEPTMMRARAHAFRSRPGPMHRFEIEHAERAEAMAESLGHVRLAAYARHLRSIGLWWLGRTAEAVDLAARAAEELDGDGSLEWHEARKFLGVALVLDGDADAGIAIQQEVLTSLRSRGASAFQLAHNLAYLGHCHRLIGDDTAALVDWTEARALCGQVGNRGTAIHVHIGLAEVAADREDHALALRHIGEALDLARAAQAQTYEPWAWTVAVRAHTNAGDLDAAAACAGRAIDGLAGVPSGESVRLAAELAGLAVCRADPAAAARLLGVVAATPDRRELPFAAPAERQRWQRLENAVEDQLGAAAGDQLAAGRRCSVREAAGELMRHVVSYEAGSSRR